MPSGGQLLTGGFQDGFLSLTYLEHAAAKYQVALQGKEVGMMLYADGNPMLLNCPWGVLRVTDPPIFDIVRCGHANCKTSRERHQDGNCLR